ncbi:MAG: hypothetical protein JOY82_08865 [Streptosporangiaceae bacterium]|nr:hypothetical protein [Streptosporangiaceae bacterium]MBV9854624.1 hypothetical protein [Streptosporangiaceae bacterium]
MYVSYQMMRAQHEETLRRAARDQVAAQARRARREASAMRRQGRQDQPAMSSGHRLARVLFPRAAA